MTYWADSLTASARINVRREIAVIRAQAGMLRVDDPIGFAATERFVDAIDCGHLPSTAAGLVKFQVARTIRAANNAARIESRQPVTSKHALLDGLAARLRLAASSERAVA